MRAHKHDNRIYNCNLFRQSCTTAGKDLKISGVTVHHQNGVTKRKIGFIENLFRTMIFHAMIY